MYIFFTGWTFMSVKESRNLFNYVKAVTISLFLLNRVMFSVIVLSYTPNITHVTHFFWLILPMDLFEIGVTAFLFSLSDVYFLFRDLEHILSKNLRKSTVVMFNNMSLKMSTLVAPNMLNLQVEQGSFRVNPNLGPVSEEEKEVIKKTL